MWYVLKKAFWEEVWALESERLGYYQLFLPLTFLVKCHFPWPPLLKNKNQIIILAAPLTCVLYSTWFPHLVRIAISTGLLTLLYFPLDFYFLLPPMPPLLTYVGKPNISRAALKSLRLIGPTGLTESTALSRYAAQLAGKVLLSAESSAPHSVLSLMGFSFLTAHRIIQTVQSHPPPLPSLYNKTWAPRATSVWSCMVVHCLSLGYELMCLISWGLCSKTPK